MPSHHGARGRLGPDPEGGPTALPSSALRCVVAQPKQRFSDAAEPRATAPAPIWRAPPRAPAATLAALSQPQPADRPLPLHPRSPPGSSCPCPPLHVHVHVHVHVLSIVPPSVAPRLHRRRRGSVSGGVLQGRPVEQGPVLGAEIAGARGGWVIVPPNAFSRAFSAAADLAQPCGQLVCTTTSRRAVPRAPLHVAVASAMTPRPRRVVFPSPDQAETTNATTFHDGAQPRSLVLARAALVYRCGHTPPRQSEVLIAGRLWAVYTVLYCVHTRRCPSPSFRKVPAGHPLRNLQAGRSRRVTLALGSGNASAAGEQSWESSTLAR